MKKTGKIFNFLMNSRWLVYIGSMLFFLLFGLAFYLVYLDLDAIKAQINDDFNEQQLILARQAASQTDLFLNNLEQEFNSLKWFCQKQESDVRQQALKAVFTRNKDMGLIDIGIMTTSGRLIEQFKEETIPELDVHEVVEVSKKKDGANMILGPLKIIHIQSINKTFIISVIVSPVNLDGTKVLLYSRLCVTRLFRKVLGQLKSGKTGYAWAIDETGIALYHPEKEFIGKNIFEARREKRPYVSFNKINMIMKEGMMKGIEGKSVYESWWHRGLEAHMIKLIAFTPVGNKFLFNGRVWSIAVVAPISEVAEAVNRAYMRHLGAEAAIIGGMFLFAGLMVIYHRRISSALKERVSEQQEYIASILENSMDAIIFTDGENQIKVWNKGAENMFGYSADEMQGHSFRRLIPPDMDAELELKRIQEEVNKKGHISNHIVPRITKSGRRLWTNISRTLILSEKNEVLGHTIIARDETEKYEMEQRIYNTEKLASIGNLAAGVAHEINNPLAVILGYTDLLLENFNEDSPEYRDLKIIEQHANNAKKIVENLLGFARITEGMEDNIDVKLCVESVIGIVKNTLFTKKINLEVKVPERLPHIKGDVREFQQVIFNLINNGVAAMKNISGNLTIEVYYDSEMVYVEISDTGDGIPDSIKPKIFDPFFTTKNVGEGTGLGLSLCYGIVNKYGGKISFKSVSKVDFPDESSGTTFTVSMPVIKNN